MQHAANQPSGEDDPHGVPEPDGTLPTSPSPSPALASWLAVTLVVLSAAAVLVLEILAGRLLAPYLGVSLETYTGIIGTVLAGIALGAACGGWLADRYDSRPLLALLFIGGGAAALAILPTIRLIGSALPTGDNGRIVLLSAVGFFPTAVVLSAVSPVVVKAQLRDLSVTGATVGRLSACGTGGAILGTFLTGFVLVRWAATTTLVVVVGVTLVAVGLALWLMFRRPWSSGVAALGALAMLGVTATDLVQGPCQTSTRYYCVAVRQDTRLPSGRLLWLDDLRHSYVDLNDPTHLEFWYIRRIVDSFQLVAATGPIDVVYLGGGGFTLPRYVRATRPGSAQTVLEIDPDLVELVERDLGFAPGPDVTVALGDGRRSLSKMPTDSADVVVGDAFGSRSVPWHLATEEFLQDVRRVLRIDGVYTANIIDNANGTFLRAEAATVGSVFQHVAVLTSSSARANVQGNSVIIGSDRPIDGPLLDRLQLQAGDSGRRVEAIDEFVADVAVLTDDFAPVDQLIAQGD
ncbi:MAG: fused MFS/spermidine synthase [Acidimicrobiales bacterium]